MGGLFNNNLKDIILALMYAKAYSKTNKNTHGKMEIKNIKKQGDKQLFLCFLIVYLAGISIAPEAIWAWISLGEDPFTVHPTETAVPKISLTVPCDFMLENEQGGGRGGAEEDRDTGGFAVVLTRK